MNENLRAFLWLIRTCEGTDDAAGYRRRHAGNYSAGVLFDSFAKHPCIIVAETNSSAAGAYQITCSTWKALQAAISLPDFTPPNQDKGALLLLKWNGAYNLIIAGNFQGAITKCVKTWTSLPGGSQPKKTVAQAKSVYQSAGGSLA